MTEMTDMIDLTDADELDLAPYEVFRELASHTPGMTSIPAPEDVPNNVLVRQNRVCLTIDDVGCSVCKSVITPENFPRSNVYSLIANQLLKYDGESYCEDHLAEVRD